MNKMLSNFWKRSLFLLFIGIFAITAVLFVYHFFPTYDNVAEAQVSSIQTNTDYIFDSYTISSGFSTENLPSYQGSLTLDGITHIFTQIRVFVNTNTNIVVLHFFGVSDDEGNYWFSVGFNTSNFSLVLLSWESDDYMEAPIYPLVNFSSLGNNSAVNAFLRNSLSVYVPPFVDHRPDLRGLYNYELNGIYTNFDFNTQTTSFSTYTNDLYVFEVYNLDSTQLTAVGTSFYTFEIAYSAGHYNVSSDTYTTNSGTFTGYAPYSPSPIGYITIAVDLSYWNLFSLYYPEYANDDNNQLDISYDDSETNLLWRQIKSNYDSIHDMNNDSRSTRSAYLQGYEAGTNADKTLLSVMWQTFNLPFRLLFGTYDDVQSSPTYGQYVGGLFNFSILGVDIRAFCIGIMSFAIVLAVVRFVLGAKGA